MMKQKKTRWKTNTHRQIQTTTQLTTICLQNYGNGINEGREKFNKTRREKKPSWSKQSDYIKNDNKCDISFMANTIADLLTHLW